MNAKTDIMLTLARKGIARAGGLDLKRRVGVALSGGADSVALLSLLVKLGYDCVALHCNFHLRGDESNRDEAHVRALTKELGIQLEVAQMDVDSRREMTSESIEMACRELRYRWFEEKAEKLELQAIAVAHHRDDQIETFFLNLLRGSGIKGLAAMKPRNGLIVRPLLETTRGQIVEYLEREGLTYVTDSTNACNDFKRNRLRNELIPQLNELFAGASDSIARTINNLRSQSDLLDDHAEELNRKYVTQNGQVEIKRLIDEERHPSAALYELLTPLGLNATIAEDIMASADKTGLRFDGKRGSYMLERGVLTPLTEADATVDSADSPGELPGIGMEIIPRSSLETLKCDSDSMLLDAAVTEQAHHWQLRRWSEGDRIKPYGMKGSKLVSDLFNDAKTTKAERDKTDILTCDGEIVWVIGLRASRLYPITDRTDRVLRLRRIKDR